MAEWESIIGLEVHAQLSTHSKLFSGAATQYGAEPNAQACLIDVALPGVLPVLNEAVLHMAVKLGIGLNANIPSQSVFSRKNYFYPDLPKGYQISQFDKPVIAEGYLDIDLETSTKRIGVTRAHLEEDAGKSLHEDFHGFSGIDLNRAGTPLLEIVSEPDLRSAEEAVTYLKTLHGLVRYLNICDGNMQEGSFRCDANVSVRPKGETELRTRTEIKNVNSFRFVERAINYEIKRQIDLYEAGQSVVQETRLYDPARNETRTMRSKEEAHDYRYFPDPDLLPVVIEPAFVEKVRDTMPELPWQKRDRFIKDYDLSRYDANLLTLDRDTAEYFETVNQQTQATPKLAANWINGELAAALNKQHLDIAHSQVSAEQLARLLERITDNTLSGKMAKSVFEALWNGDAQGDVDHIIETKGLKQITDTGTIEKVVDEVITNHPEQVAQYRAGKDKLFGFFVGQVMKATQGKANPKQLNELLHNKLSE